MNEAADVCWVSPRSMTRCFSQDDNVNKMDSKAV